MLTSRNFVSLSGGLVRDPETPTDNIVSFSIGVDGAGSEKGQNNPSGYFECKVFLNDSKFTASAVAEQVRNALSNGTFTKGSRVSLIGRLAHERWVAKDGTKASRITIIVESIDIFSRSNAATGAASAAPASTSPAQVASVPTDF